MKEKLLADVCHGRCDDAAGGRVYYKENIEEKESNT